MATQDEMLRAIHAADKSTLTKRFTPAELQAAYAKLPGKGGSASGGSTPQAPAGQQVPKSLGDVAAGTTTSNAPGIFNATVNSNVGQAVQGNQISNPQQYNPFGQSTVTYDANGVPTVTQGLSQANQQVLGGIQGSAASAGQNLGGILSGNSLGYSAATGAGQFGNDAIGRYQGALYGSLTQGLDQKKAQAQQDFEQNLANRGIAPGSGDAYKNALKDFSDNWDSQYANAQNQAILGGQQMFNSTTQNLGQIAAQGFFNPQFQANQFGGPQQVNYSDVNAQNKAANAQMTTANANAALAKRRYSGGGSSGGGAASTPSPYFGGVAP